eukprot:TRINITY_DN6910_c0_g1_i1.p1 TRINITY_DN6910_c0_g1~~TRINITY_DN6910_c0_g1_i1.p1  ORF type:complete len:176 (-),score=22.41 TRINITY_DN6910_c0_g1_i1:561-1088(-)
MAPLEGVNIIFLDLDGVLVTEYPGIFQHDLAQNLKRLVDATDATVVLSSDWRRWWWTRLHAKMQLAWHGISFSEYTPCLHHPPAQRPREIMQWMKEYTEDPENEPVANWVAIDDRRLLSEIEGTSLVGHFVQTHPRVGLTPAKVDQCIAVLKGLDQEDDMVSHQITCKKQRLQQL